jgi:hypothetical protein
MRVDAKPRSAAIDLGCVQRQRLVEQRPALRRRNRSAQHPAAHVERQGADRRLLPQHRGRLPLASLRRWPRLARALWSPASSASLANPA